MRKVLFYVTLLIFIEVVFYWIIFDPYQLNYQFNFNICFPVLNLYFGIDGISLFFIFLISFLVPCCFLFNWKNNIIALNEYCICLFLMECILIFVFTILDLLLFYIFFESILVPMFIFIGILGSRGRRIHAAYLLFFYTLFGSLIMLGSIIMLYVHVGTSDLQSLQFVELSLEREIILWLAFFFSFSIKIPMYPFHIWLPEAHVEAPTEGSVLLAGILLKMGAYGFVRFLIPILWNATVFFIPIIFLLCSLAITYTSFVTLRQIDLKRIIAYSSVAHMNVAVLGLFSMNVYSVVGSLFLMIGHGVVSAALFFVIGILYDRYKTRILKYYSGVVYAMPLYSVMCFVFILGNVSFPLTCNFIGELLVFIGILYTNIYTIIALFVGIFLCTIYSMLLYNKINFCLFNTKYFVTLIDITRIEFFLLSPFVFFIFLFGICPNLVFNELLISLYSLFFA